MSRRAALPGSPQFIGVLALFLAMCLTLAACSTSEETPRAGERAAPDDGRGVSSNSLEDGSPEPDDRGGGRASLSNDPHSDSGEESGHEATKEAYPRSVEVPKRGAYAYFVYHDGEFADEIILAEVRESRPKGFVVWTETHRSVYTDEYVVTSAGFDLKSTQFERFFVTTDCAWSPSIRTYQDPLTRGRSWESSGKCDVRGQPVLRNVSAVVGPLASATLENDQEHPCLRITREVVTRFGTPPHSSRVVVNSEECFSTEFGLVIHEQRTVVTETPDQPPQTRHEELRLEQVEPQCLRSEC